MKLSVITVNFNNPIGLERTIKSVINQTDQNFEYVIIDGFSTKGDVAVLRKYSIYNIKWISERDTGIYNAMNKGVNLSTGDYCLFLNSGDELYSNTTISEINNLKLTADFVQGIIARPGDKVKFIKPPKECEITLGWYYWGNNNYHQASLIRRAMLVEYPYDERLRYSADMKFNVECLIKNGCSYQDIDIVIAFYEYGGVSSTAFHLEEDFKIFDDLFGTRIVKDYKELSYIHHFPINRIAPILYNIGNSFLMKKIRNRKNKR